MRGRERKKSRARARESADASSVVRASEGCEERKEEDAVGEVRGEDHLEERQRDQQELGAARPGVEELEPLRQGREVRERDGGGVAPKRHDDRGPHDA
jgi:hypothetical protein